MATFWRKVVVGDLPLEFAKQSTNQRRRLISIIIKPINVMAERERERIIGRKYVKIIFEPVIMISLRFIITSTLVTSRII